MQPTRCWKTQDALMIEYHDYEWGIPVHDDALHFEHLLLDAFQAGLSWKTILHRRENFREAFDQFNFEKIARYTDEDLELRLQDPGIIRNKLKVYSTRKNARAFIKVREEFGSFDAFIWQFTGGEPKINHFEQSSQIPMSSPESDAMSKALKKRGFSFVGTTICYAYMQEVGMVNDHLVSCFCHPASQP